MKKKTLVVEDLRNTNGSKDSAFRVVKLINTTLFVIGRCLSVDMVSAKCDNEAWIVTIVAKK